MTRLHYIQAPLMCSDFIKGAVIQHSIEEKVSCIHRQNTWDIGEMIFSAIQNKYNYIIIIVH